MHVIEHPTSHGQPCHEPARSRRNSPSSDGGSRFPSTRRTSVSTPDDAEVLEALGHLLTRSGRLSEGLAADRRLVELRPDEPVAHYNLACSLALVGDVEAALERLRHAMSLGFRDVAFIRKDRDLKSLRAIRASRR